VIRDKIRVFLIEDSRLYQAFLTKVIESDECLTVAGTADSGCHALEMIPQLMPDIITLDLVLPDVDGFVLLEEILRQWKIPVIVVCGDSKACERAIRMGAADFIEKMQDADPKKAEEFRILLPLKLKMQKGLLSETTVPRRQVRVPVPEDLQQPDRLQKPDDPQKPDRVQKPDDLQKPDRVQRPDFLQKTDRLQNFVIAIGASLGGTEATLQILAQLPPDLPGIVIVQHMPQEFTGAYALRLDSCCRIRVREAENGDPVLPGTALVARGGEQLRICRTEAGYRVRVGETEKSGGFCPSVDVLFRSAAEAAGADALGIILTGMGRDGAAGLRCMHDKGAFTMGQSKETCAVFGMPKAAWSLGGVDMLLPPDKIADEIIHICSRLKK